MIDQLLGFIDHMLIAAVILGGAATVIGFLLKPAILWLL